MPANLPSPGPRGKDSARPGNAVRPRRNRRGCPKRAHAIPTPAARSRIRYGAGFPPSHRPATTTNSKQCRKIDSPFSPYRIARMTRPQMQLPDERHRRAKRFSAEREISLADITHRSIKRALESFPDSRPARKNWQLPVIESGSIRVPLARLHDVAAEEETTRSTRRR
jgi:hypothetical protein